MKQILTLILIFLLISCGSKQEENQVKPIRPVRYGKVILSSGGQIQAFSGVAQSANEVNLSFKVAGTLNTMKVKLGDLVRKGQLIAQIDPADFSIQADQASASKKGAEANLKSAETQLIIAKSNYIRIEKLYENNSVPLSEFEQAKSNYETAQAQFEASQTQVTSSSKQLQTARNQVDYTRLTAPFTGIITNVAVEANELVNSGTPIAVLSEIGDPEVNVGIPENVISQIEPGQKVQVSFSVLEDQMFHGTVSEVGFAAGGAPTYPVIIQITDPSDKIRPGMATTVLFNFDNQVSNLDKQYLTSPVPAIGEDSNGNFVFLLEPKGNNTYTAKKKAIKIGELLPQGFEVLEGLKVDDLVATAGLKSLLDGMEVKLLEAE